MTAISHLPLRRAIIETGQAMNRLGINQGASGNLSVRAGDGFLITPSSLPYDEMQVEDVVEMALDGTWRGDRRPSSEWRFHRDILAARPDMEAVVHAHPTFCTVLAVHRKPIPPFHYMVALAGGPDIRCGDYATFGTQDLSDNALKALEGRTACLLANHGLLALGGSLKAALALAVEVEALARQYVHALMLGQPVILPDAEIARVQDKMRRMKYGQNPDDTSGDTPGDASLGGH